jgi:uncharacterized RDD family membrane protein YckC
MKTVDVSTSHNISIDCEAATVFNRDLALFVDLLVMFGYWLIMTLFLVSFGFSSIFSDMMTVAMCILVLLPIMFYSLLSEFLMKGQIIGKLATGIQVVNLNGENASLNDYTLRWTFRIIDFWFSVGAIGALFVSTTEKGQRLGDILSQTAVVRNKPEQIYTISDVLGIDNRMKHSPTYSNAAVFTDEDLILIKNALNRVKKFLKEPHKLLIRDLATRTAETLKLDQVPEKKVTFLQTLLQDYILLTR